jgi:hypothetical protein
MNRLQCNQLALVSSSNIIVFAFWAYGAASLVLHGVVQIGLALSVMLTV